VISAESTENSGLRASSDYSLLPIHQIFCTEGIEIKLNSKDDMYDFCNLFSDHEWCSKHEVLAYNCCDKFVYLSDDDFTYNDFLYRLNEKQ
jgi:hypothetical protein